MLPLRSVPLDSRGGCPYKALGHLRLIAKNTNLNQSSALTVDSPAGVRARPISAIS